MAIKIYADSAFDYFKCESSIIGRMVAEYGALEWLLCLLVSHVVKDLGLAVKTLYRSRGETQRVNLADALIRNQYAHTNWIRAAGDRLCYFDIEELAEQNDVVSMGNISLYKLDMDIIEDQARFFGEVAQNLTYLCMEVQYLNGSTTLTGFHYIQNIALPKMAVKIK